MKTLINTIAAATLLTTTAVIAAEQVIGTDSGQTLSIAIYNADRALVHDTRKAHLTAGTNALAFSGISDQIIPQSALLSGVGLTTLEQNFNYDLLSYNTLMEKAVGTTVTTETVNPATGDKTFGTAKILAYNNDTPVLQINGKIEANFPGRILFDKIPENLRSKPTLVMHVHSEQAAEQPLQLNYLTQGLGWNADYVGQLNADETQMNLNGFVTLTNNTNADFLNTRLQLVAGDVNLVREVMQPRYKMNRVAYGMAADTAQAMPEVENLSDFYLYTLPRKTDILSHQTKQVALLSATAVPVQKIYEFDNRLRPTATPYKNVNPRVYLTFTNTEESRLGLALPKGVVRLYKESAAGDLLFIGEDNITHTAKKQTVRLNTGDSFDIYADAVRTTYTKPTEHSSDATYKITVFNTASTSKTVYIFENVSGNFQIITESTPSERVTSNRLKWTLNIPANGEQTLTYRIQVQHD